MKILHVVPYFFPAWGYGGPPRVVYELAKQQVAMGHQVTVLTTTALDVDKLPAGAVEVDGIKIFRLNNLSNTLIWKLHFSTPLGVDQFLNKKNFDVVHLHEVRTLLNYLVLKKISSKTKVCISPWGTLPHNGSMIMIKKIFDFFLLPLLRNRTIVSFGQTTHEVNELRKWRIGSKQLLIPLGTTKVNQLKLLSKEESRKKLGIDTGLFVVTYLGRFSPHKGLDLLVRSFAHFSHQKSDVRLLLVGRDDGYESKLLSLIKDNKIENKVILTGPLYDAERFIAYRAANVFLFCPDVYEETGTVCIEALSSGLPVIHTKEAEVPFFKPSDGVIQAKRNPQYISCILDRLYLKELKVNQKILDRYFYWPEVAKLFLEGYSH